MRAGILLGVLSLSIIWDSPAPLMAQSPPVETRALERERTAQPVNTEASLDLAMSIIDLVLDRHIDPPTRQEMLLAGVKAMYRQARLSPPPGLSREISELADQSQQKTFLREKLAEFATAKRPPELLEAALLDGLTQAVSGNPHRMPAKEYRVQQQLQGNRYVGIGIALGSRKEESTGKPTVTINQVFPGGTAHTAGLRAEDAILAVDGQSTSEIKLAEVVDRLRGEEGTGLTLVVQGPKDAEPRTVEMVRSVVRFETIMGHGKQADGTWNFRPEPQAAVAYVSISEVRASTLLELRQLEPQLTKQGFQALVLDLRENSGGNFHDTLLLADGLLPQGPIGRVRDARGEKTFESGPDCLFRDWPLAVLVGKGTAGAAEWLAAALHDRRGALLIGQATAGTGYVHEWLELPDGQGAIHLQTGVLQRADGQTLVSAAARPGALDALSARVAQRVEANRSEPVDPAQLQPDEKVASEKSDPQLTRAIQRLVDRLKLTSRP